MKIVFLWLLACLTTLAQPSALVIQAEKAAIKTEGGPNAGGGWNLWSNGRVGQTIRCIAAGKYQVVRLE